MTDLSILVVTWNTRDLVLACLAAIERHVSSPPGGVCAEVIVVDNGSTDGTVSAVRERHPNVAVVALETNVGFAAGCNAGARRASGRHLLLLNSDAMLCEGAVERCVAYLDAHSDVAVVGPGLVGTDDRPHHSVHNEPRVLTEIVPKGLLEWAFPKHFPSWRSLAAQPRDVEAVVGAALFVRHDVWKRLGGLCEDYFFFLEETDFCRRVRLLGDRVVVLPDARVSHVLGASSKKKNPALTRIEYHRSLYRFYRIHRGRGWMAVVMTLRIAKCLLYVSTQAPLALAGGRHLERWQIHVRVAGWHLRGCPADVGVAQVGSEPTAT